MYTIVNEKGINSDGKMTYDIFGVGLANTSDGKLDFDLIKAQLMQFKKNMSYISTADYALIRMLNDSDKKSVFSNSSTMVFF